MWNVKSSKGGDEWRIEQSVLPELLQQRNGQIGYNPAGYEAIASKSKKGKIEKEPLQFIFMDNRWEHFLYALPGEKLVALRAL